MRISSMKIGLVFLALFTISSAQEKGGLTVEKIMRDPAWIGSEPSRIFWAVDGSRVYFNWNPDGAPADSLYSVSRKGGTPLKVSPEERRRLPSRYGSDYSLDYRSMIFSRNGDLFLLNIPTGKERRLTNTVETESVPAFSLNEDKIIYRKGDNLYTIRLADGLVTQVTDFHSGRERPPRRMKKSEQDEWLSEQALRLSEVLQQRKERSEESRRIREQENNLVPGPKTIYVQEKRILFMQLSPDEHFVIFGLYQRPADTKSTIVPDYVTESGYTEDMRSRSKVGTPQGIYEMGIYQIQADTVLYLSLADLPGIFDTPDLTEGEAAPLPRNQKSGAAQSREDTKGKKNPRPVSFGEPVWSRDGRHAVISIYSQDNKDRWIAEMLPDSARLNCLDHQHDYAWIGGPGTGGWGGGTLGFLPDNRRVWFQSEASGYSHLYTVDIISKEKKQLTSGNFEIYSPRISRDGNYWYFTANKEHPGVRHFYRMRLDGGPLQRVTYREGGNEVVLSPDEKMLAVRFSTSNRPWQLYLMENKAGAPMQRITSSISREFLDYDWRKPEIVTFQARDGAMVHARLYKPEEPGAIRPAVIFVHGAGYLQNAHTWWSSYFREYMFNNLLCDHGYTVLDIDYRGSAGYGRDWRTAIYRHMGSKDLDDQVDGARYLIHQHQVDPKRIGIYGGSYGGFITLMAMFTQADVFSAGAALRSVTDWAHYNHGYTSDILNTPVADSLAYVRSSPIYYAEGLKGGLLMCHGMIDTNVHFQDIVRLTQRLIELGKDHWELAVYPLEGHGFREPSSWTDEYKRIFNLYEEYLK